MNQDSQQLYAGESSLKSTFSGLINQREFWQRLHFIRSRILNGYSREEVSFLLGRTPHFIKDYEELAGVALDGEDMINYTFLFNKLLRSMEVFDHKKNDMDISYEKRMLRGIKLSSVYEITYEFIHPWTVRHANKPIVIKEKVRQAGEYSEEIEQIRKRISAKIADGYMDTIRAPMQIYKMLSDSSVSFGTDQICRLRRVLYEMVHAEKLGVKIYYDKFYFIRKPSII